MPLEGEFVRLRAIEPDDLDRYLAWLNDPDVTRTLATRYPIGRDAEREIIERLSRSMGYREAVFAIDVRESGEHIGSVGLDGGLPEGRLATLGIVIGAKEQWGRGYGFDAIRTALRFAFWEMNLRLVRLEVLETNERAVRLYERIGFVVEGTRRNSFRKGGVDLDAHMMAITRDAFEARHGAPPDLRQEVLP